MQGACGGCGRGGHHGVFAVADLGQRAQGTAAQAEFAGIKAGDGFAKFDGVGNGASGGTGHVVGDVDCGGGGVGGHGVVGLRCHGGGHGGVASSVDDAAGADAQLSAACGVGRGREHDGEGFAVGTGHKVAQGACTGSDFAGVKAFDGLVEGDGVGDCAGGRAGYVVCHCGRGGSGVGGRGRGAAATTTVGQSSQPEGTKQHGAHAHARGRRRGAGRGCGGTTRCRCVGLCHQGAPLGQGDCGLAVGGCRHLNGAAFLQQGQGVLFAQGLGLASFSTFIGVEVFNHSQ